MSWMQSLYHTYEQSMALEIDAELKPLPISHTLQNAHINIVIDGQGQFRRAAVLKKTQVVLPATEQSAGRASGEAPHPLADKVQYVAGDYAVHGGKKKAYFTGYCQQLRRWCESPYTHPSACAVLKYIEQQQLVADLVNHQIMHLDAAGMLLQQWPDKNQEAPELLKLLPKDKGLFEQGSALVCWTVEAEDIVCPHTWLDHSLQQSWIDYDNTAESLKGLCFVSGEVQPLAMNHPAKLRHSGDKAKLISSNDLSGFTFKGRFTDTLGSKKTSGLQAAAVGLLTTQKAHNALRWLISRPQQAFRNGDQVIVSWAVTGKAIPPLLASSIDLDLDLDNLDEVPEQIETQAAEKPITDHGRDLGNRFASRLNNYMRGYRAELNHNDQISIMALDSATPGRMGITYYREQLPEEYLQRITQWHTDMAWPQRVTKEIPQAKGKAKNTTLWPLSAPSPFVIMQVLYGDILKSSDTLKKQFYQRLIPCLLEGRAIPQDFVKLSQARARNPQGQDYWEWERALGVACSLFRAAHMRGNYATEKKEYSMGLDTSMTSRDYLYGRLLALAERLEQVALWVAGTKRPTTAQRLMQRFSDRPYETWLIIYKQLDPYMRQMKTSRPGFLQNISDEIDQVMNMFDREEYMNSKPLSGEFLLGFHCQRLALANKKDEPESTKKMEYEA